MIKDLFYNRYKVHALLKDLDLTSYDLKNAICDHQGLAWGMNISLEETPEEIIFRKIYQYINSGIEYHDFFYKGDLFAFMFRLAP